MLKSTIPRIIHQIWLGPLVPPKQAMRSWKKFHPDWEYRFWNEKNIPHLINQDAFDASPNWHQKSDILRYEILHRYGGIYIDSDEFCIKPIDPLFEKAELEGFTVMAGKEGSTVIPNLVANGVLACAKEEPFMQRVIDQIDIHQPDRDTWEMVGPLYLTKMIEKYQPAILIMEPKTFYPIHHKGKKGFRTKLSDYEDDADVFGVQMWGSTYTLYRPKWYRHPIELMRFYYHRFRGKEVSRVEK